DSVCDLAFGGGDHHGRHGDAATVRGCASLAEAAFSVVAYGRADWLGGRIRNRMPLSRPRQRAAGEDADADHPDAGRRRMIEQPAIVLCRIIPTAVRWPLTD